MFFHLFFIGHLWSFRKPFEPHSTVTAKVTIEHEALRENEEGRTVAIYSTDLSAAFDTISHSIIRSKLEHYGFRGQSGNLLKSYLHGREQYVEIETKSSEVKESIEVSVIQGSKLSGLLYNLYSNEVPLVHHIMKNPEQVDITNEVKHDDKDIKHEVTNFVDDSNSVISAKDEDNLKVYLEKYTKLMKIYYSTNFLKMNESKTNIMVIPKRNPLKNWITEEIKTDDEPIKTCASTKILGSTINSTLTNDSEINNLNSSLNNILRSLKMLGKKSTMKIRLSLANAAFMGRMNYMLPTYTNLTTLQHGKLHKVMMNCARWVVGGNTMRMRNKTILSQLNWIPIQKMIQKSSVKVMHDIIQSKEPEDLYNLLRIPRRKTAKMGLKKYPKKSKMSKSPICEALKNYNELPDNVKVKEKDKFKSTVNKYYKTKYKLDFFG